MASWLKNLPVLPGGRVYGGLPALGKIGKAGALAGLRSRAWASFSRLPKPAQTASAGDAPPPVCHDPGMSRPVVLVTGSSRGLGRGIAVALSAEGYDLAIHYAANAAAAAETVAACRAVAPDAAQRFLPFAAELASAAERSTLVERVVGTLGHLDALVNNAGMAPRERTDITQASEASFDELIAVNLKGPYFLSQSAANYWLAHPATARLAGGYKLLFVTSVSAAIATVTRGDYCISKAGLAMAAKLWATRLAADGVQVLELRPGIMETDMTAGVREHYDALIASGRVPIKRWGTPEDVGRAVQAICRGDFPFSTGDVISLDGGLHLRRL
jgi:3-oxoacyl-[acyl-carrier protein] reductase